MEQAKKKIIRKVKPAAAMPRLERVAAYCRVSSGKDAMLHSLSAQISAYSTLIQKTPGWLFVKVYVDSALTGTKDSRAGFQQMLADCRAGQIDLVICKSISRFARDTVTLLTTVRELKALGIDVYFEEEDGLVLADYKTDRVAQAQELRDRYHIQLEIYADALEQITGKQVKQKLIYSFALGCEIPL